VPEVRIDAEPRTEFGKGPARRARRVGKVPAILYGHGTETRHVTVPGHDVLLALRTPNVLIRLDGLPGGSELALPKAVQRDAIKGTVEHVDLLLVRHGEKVTVDIPVQVTGEVVADGLLDQQLVQVTVEAEATNIPPCVEVDIDGLGIGSAVYAGDLKLPAGVTLAVEPDTLILHVVAVATAEQFEADLGVPEGEAAEAAAGGAEPAPAPAPEGDQEVAGGDQSA
jgi:large subunit ribosomal protein L25